ncbi:cupin domain-containing protein [Paracoccaceae bacterium]|nr:cupin domain-containing protein [Paracoccaceae bacterium]
MSPSTAERRHHHAGAEQFFYVASGVPSMELDAEISALHLQQGIHVSASASHQITNRPRSDLLFTVTSTPPRHVTSRHVDRVMM